MKSLYSILLIILSISISQAQVVIPEESQYAEIKQEIGFTEVEIQYRRPNMKGRKIFGEIVPWGSLWRTGANANTKFFISRDVFLEGLKIPKGNYALYTIPDKDEWTIIIHKDTARWGHYGYKETNDLLRFKVKSVQHKEEVETLTINFADVSETEATMEIRWGKIGVPIRLKIDAKAQDAEVLKNIAETLKKPDDRDEAMRVSHDYLHAAMYYWKNGKDLNQALAWMYRAIELQNVSYFHYFQSAILGDLKRYDEAIAASETGLAIFMKTATNKEWIWRHETQIKKWKKMQK